MGVTLDQMLMLAGRLQDAQGFDAPRERFRRFLGQHVGDVKTARTLIEECQHTPGDQHQRALADLVVLLGRFIGFETTSTHGIWRSRPRAQIVVRIASDQPAEQDVEELARSVATLAAASGSADWRTAGLCVATPLYMNRIRLEAALKALDPAPPISLVRLRSLMFLADMVSAGRMSHEQVVRLLESNVPLDLIAELLEKFTDGQSLPVSESIVAATLSNPDHPNFWIATVGPDHATRPEEFLELVVGKRHIFGVTDIACPGAAARSGDWICFHISGKGIVGHARVTTIATNGAGLRDAHRFRQLLQLEDLALYLGNPAGPDAEAQLRLRSAPLSPRRNVQRLVAVSRESFQAMTAPRAIPIEIEATERSSSLAEIHPESDR
jgi:hypothetical protein